LSKENLRKLVNTRNYYTHYDQDTKNKVFKEEILFHVTNKLKAMILMMILDEVGINISTTIRKMKKSYRWLYIFNEKSDGSTATVAGSIKDLTGGIDADPITSPVYKDSELKFKRRAA